jgi:hypothetical protein
MTRFGRSVLAVCCLLLLVSVLVVQAVEAMTGNEYRSYSVLAKVSYVNGVMEGWTIANHFMGRDGEPDVRWESSVGSVARCAEKKMTTGQVSAIVEKYMDTHPAEWHYNMAALIWSAMVDVCPLSLPDIVDPRGPKGK